MEVVGALGLEMTWVSQGLGAGDGPDGRGRVGLPRVGSEMPRQRGRDRHFSVRWIWLSKFHHGSPMNETS